MRRTLILVCAGWFAGGGLCVGQMANRGDALVHLDNYGKFPGEEWPILLANGRTNQLAAWGTKVQLLARALDSDTAFQLARKYSLPCITTFEVLQVDPGFFD